MELELQGVGETVDRFLLAAFLFINNTAIFCRRTASHFEGNEVVNLL
jgi:hypothetical protein